METIKSGIYSNYGYNEEDVEQVKISINKIKKDGYFKGCNNLNIYYQVFSVINEKGRIVISHGFSECIEKYNVIHFKAADDIVKRFIKGEEYLYVRIWVMLLLHWWLEENT